MPGEKFKTWVVSAVVLFLLPGFVVASGRVVLDFNDKIPGDSLPETLRDAHLMALLEPRIDFLTPDSTPATPFADGAHGLLVERVDPEETEPRVRVRIKPFAPSAPPKVGWIEIEMVVNSANYNGLDFGSGAISDLSSANHSSYDGKVIGAINLNVGRPLDVVIFPEDTNRILYQATPSPEMGDPFLLRITWDFSGDTPTVQIFLNGVSLADSSAGDLILVLPKDQVGDGIDYLSLMLRDAILGRITVSE